MAELIALPIQTAELVASGYMGQPEGNIDLTENNVQVNVAPYKYATPKIPIQSDKDPVTPTAEQQTIYPDEGYAGMSQIVVKSADLQEGIVRSGNTPSTILPVAPHIGFSKVYVEPTPLITKQITENGTYSAADDNVAGYSEVTVAVPVPRLQTKQVTPQATQFDVEPSAGFDGLSKVTVNATPIEVLKTFTNYIVNAELNEE